MSDRRSLRLDSVGLHVLHHALANVAAEMGLVVMRTAYSPIFSEGLDFCTVLLDRHGNMIAEKNYVPSMMGASVFSVRWTLEEKGADYFRPGDVVIHNDPYRGGCHLPEHMVMKPIFCDDELVGFSGCIGHISEVGGKAAGSFAADATEVYQEGLRLPPVKLLRGGERNEDVWSVVLANHRTPRMTWGDLHAMIGALNVGERRVHEIVERYGSSVLLDGAAKLIEHSEHRIRAAITEIPDGEYRAETRVEDDGVQTEPFDVRVAVTVAGDELICDFTGSSAQAAGPMNATYVVTASAAYNAMFTVADPTMQVPRNSGCYRPVRVIAPSGTVVNVRHPGASVSGNTELQPKLVDLLLAALAPAVPDRVAATSGATNNNLLLGGVNPETGAYQTIYLLEGAGGGATARADGNAAEIPRTSNCRNTPTEILEHRFPIEVLEYALVPDSGGAGRHRGGLGVRRRLRLMADLTLTAVFERAQIAAVGLEDGEPGSLSTLRIKQLGTPDYRPFTEVFGVASATKFANVQLRAGDELLYVTPGGGGFGPPSARDPAALRRDISEGYVTPGAAAARYGVTTTPEAREE